MSTMSWLPLRPTPAVDTVGSAVQASDPVLADLPWYRSWVLRQARSLPERLRVCLPDDGKPESEGEDKSEGDPSFDARFFRLWGQVREVMEAPGQKTIEGMANQLVERGAVRLEQNYEATQSVRDLVFAVLGWQTMLYRAEVASQVEAGGFRIVGEMDGFGGDAQICLAQPASAGKQKLPLFLVGFGLMLPPPNKCATGDAHDRELFGQTKTVSVRDLNAHVLTRVCGVDIRWTDSLACHLELDRLAGVLYLFRYPSFCLSTLAQPRRREPNAPRGSPLHRCGLEQPDLMPWAGEEGVTELLREVLLSYRLIFGQNRRSRAAFRRLRPFSGVPLGEQDPLLAQLCGRKRFDIDDCGGVRLVQRDEYDLAGDFAHLRSKMVRLGGYAVSRKPQSLRQLWSDKRESTAWLALWSVLIFGSLSLFLALVQCVFQILQYVDGLQGGG